MEVVYKMSGGLIAVPFAVYAWMTLIICTWLLIKHTQALYSQLKEKKIKCNCSFIFSYVLFVNVIVGHIIWFWLVYKQIDTQIECYYALVHPVTS